MDFYLVEMSNGQFYTFLADDVQHAKDQASDYIFDSIHVLNVFLCIKKYGWEEED